MLKTLKTLVLLGLTLAAPGEVEAQRREGRSRDANLTPKKVKASPNQGPMYYVSDLRTKTGRGESAEIPSAGGTYFRPESVMPATLKMEMDSKTGLSYMMMQAIQQLYSNATLAENPYASAEQNEGAVQLCLETMRHIGGTYQTACDDDGVCTRAELQTVYCSSPEPGNVDAANVAKALHRTMMDELVPQITAGKMHGGQLWDELISRYLSHFDAATRCQIIRKVPGHDYDSACAEIMRTVKTKAGRYVQTRALNSTSYTVFSTRVLREERTAARLAPQMARLVEPEYPGLKASTRR